MDLERLIDGFGEMKEKSDELKKEVDGYNKQIKSIMGEVSLDEYKTSKYKVKLSNIESRSFDEERLLAKLKELGATDCIKTVEIVDMTNLENAIYNKKVDASKLADCQIITKQQRLTITKVKEKK